MRMHFISRLSLLLMAGFLVVVSQVWTGNTLQWLFVAGGIAMILVALATAARSTMAQRGIDALIVALGAWTIIQAFIFSGADLKWWSFACACALAGLSVVGLTLHELTTERVVHQLDVVGTRSREEAPISAA